MAAVEVTITGVLYDKTQRTAQPVVLIGEASLTGLGVGGGPIIPPQQPNPPGTPTFPIWGPPGIELPPSPGYPPVAGHPLPPIPDNPAPPTVPPPGSPPVILSPGGAHPEHPIAVPDYIIVDYPGIGKVLVPRPLPA